MIRGDIIIVGGGIAGLTAAGVLRRAGLHALVLDKGRGPGGRLATLSVDVAGNGCAVFDYGAQQISAREPEFRRQMAAWLESGVAVEWCRGLPAPGEPEPDDRTPRYRGAAGVRGIALDLADGIDLHLRTRVTRISRNSEAWAAETDDGRCFQGSALLLTAPVPQALELLDASGLPLSAAHTEMLREITYEPCIAVLALADGRSTIPEPGAVRLEGEPLIWAADNRVKGISPESDAVTLHAGPRTSERLWPAADNDVARELLAAAEPWIGRDPHLVTVHRWRYSRPVSTPDIPFAMLGTEPPLALAGDGFGGSRVEGAWTSGRTAGGWLGTQLGRPALDRSKTIPQGVTAPGPEEK